MERATGGEKWEHGGRVSRKVGYRWGGRRCRVRGRSRLLARIGQLLALVSAMAARTIAVMSPPWSIAAKAEGETTRRRRQRAFLHSVVAGLRMTPSENGGIFCHVDVQLSVLSQHLDSTRHRLPVHTEHSHLGRPPSALTPALDHPTTMLPTKTLASGQRTSPITSLAKATAQCADESRVYGACILANYQAVEKDMCKREFEMFKQCVTKKVSSSEQKAKREVPRS